VPPRPVPGPAPLSIRRSPPLSRLVLAVLTPAAFASPAQGQDADLIVVGGTIHTLDPERPRAEALAVAGGRVVAVGDGSAVLALRGETTAVLDLGGRTVIPGLIDAHGHVLNLGKALRTVDLLGTTGAADVADRVRRAAATRRPGEWILGRGWDQNDWEERAFPTRELLDSAAPENPVYLTRVDGHAGWVNGPALEAGGVHAGTPDPPGGRIVRGPGGEPTGILVDAAEALVESVIPEADSIEAAKRFAAAREHLLALGVTGVHEMGVTRGELELYRAWAAGAEPGPRLVVYLSASDALLDWWETARGGFAADPDGRFRVRGTKTYADGALGSRGAALLDPYSDDPENRGLLRTEPGAMRELARRSLALGLQPAIHAIGDRGNRIALDALAAALRDAGPGGRVAPDDEDLRPRVEHAQVVAPDDIPRFGSLGVIASVQPSHATSDMPWAGDRVGPERIEGAYAWQRLRRAAPGLACGSDFPVESANPFHGLYAAITRQDPAGRPEGGWRAAERLTREQALACFARDAARAAGMGDEVGTLAVGRRADFLVLDRDPLAAAPLELRETRVLRTVIGGETVYESADAGLPPVAPRPAS
jgi:predicted amidohydrolase YtcJ